MWWAAAMTAWILKLQAPFTNGNAFIRSSQRRCLCLIWRRYWSICFELGQSVKAGSGNLRRMRLLGNDLWLKAVIWFDWTWHIVDFFWVFWLFWLWYRLIGVFIWELCWLCTLKAWLLCWETRAATTWFLSARILPSSVIGRPKQNYECSCIFRRFAIVSGMCPWVYSLSKVFNGNGR